MFLCENNLLGFRTRGRYVMKYVQSSTPVDIWFGFTLSDSSGHPYDVSHNSFVWLKIIILYKVIYFQIKNCAGTV